MRNKVLSYFVVIILLTYVNVIAFYETFVFVTAQPFNGWRKPFHLLIAIWLFALASNILIPKWIFEATKRVRVDELKNEKT